MKIVACLDDTESPVWIAIPTDSNEIQSALREVGLEPLGDDVIDYDEDNIPDWGLIVPLWRHRPVLSKSAIDI